MFNQLIYLIFVLFLQRGESFSKKKTKKKPLIIIPLVIQTLKLNLSFFNMKLNDIDSSSILQDLVDSIRD